MRKPLNTLGYHFNKIVTELPRKGHKAMSQKITHLRPEDEISREQYLAEIQNYSNQDAQELGYPNIEVFHLAHHLSKITGEWRRTKTEKLVSEYRNTLYQMILKGYDLDGLPIE